MSDRLRLHGYPVSNYVSIVRAALSEKAIPYESVERGGSRDDAFLALNPMGKIPVLETERGCLAETVAILDYLDDRYPEPTMRPASAFDRARMRQINNVLQLYVETPARGLYVGVFAAGSHSTDQLEAARAMLDRSTEALSRLAAPSPYLLGDAPTQSDLFAFYTFELVDRLTKFLWSQSIVAELGWNDWRDMMRSRASTRAVLPGFEQGLRAYLASRDAPFRETASPQGQLTDA